MERFRGSGIERQTATFDGICRILPSARRDDVVVNEVKDLAAAIGAAAALFSKLCVILKIARFLAGRILPEAKVLAVILRVPRVE